MICLTYVWQPLLMLISVPRFHPHSTKVLPTSSFNSSQHLHQNKTFHTQSSSSFRLEIPHRTTVSFEMTHCFWTDSWLKVTTFSDSFYDGIPWPSWKSSELLTESIPFCFNTLRLPTATIRQLKNWVWKSAAMLWAWQKTHGEPKESDGSYSRSRDSSQKNHTTRDSSNLFCSILQLHLVKLLPTPHMATSGCTFFEAPFFAFFGIESAFPSGWTLDM